MRHQNDNVQPAQDAAPEKAAQAPELEGKPGHGQPDPADLENPGPQPAAQADEVEKKGSSSFSPKTLLILVVGVFLILAAVYFTHGRCWGEKKPIAEEVTEQHSKLNEVASKEDPALAKAKKFDDDLSDLRQQIEQIFWMNPKSFHDRLVPLELQAWELMNHQAGAPKQNTSLTVFAEKVTALKDAVKNAFDAAPRGDGDDEKEDLDLSKDQLSQVEKLDLEIGDHEREWRKVNAKAASLIEIMNFLGDQPGTRDLMSEIDADFDLLQQTSMSGFDNAGEKLDQAKRARDALIARFRQENKARLTLVD